VNLTSATSDGFTHVVTASSFTLARNGDFAFHKGISWPYSCAKLLWLKPVPTWPV
jgi:hypothetical protein